MHSEHDAALIPSLSPQFLETAAGISATAGSELAELSYGLMYSSSEGESLRERRT